MKKKLIFGVVAVVAVAAAFFVGLFVGKGSDKTENNEQTSEVKKEKGKNVANNNAPDGTPVKEHGKLKVEGTAIVDEKGQKFQLKGVSTHGIAWFPQYINKDAFSTMRDDWHINTVRLAMYTDPSAGYSESIHEKVKEGVKYATELGLYVIIDWHILSDGNPQTNKANALKFFKEMAGLYKDNPNVLYEICNEPNGDVQWARDIKPYAEEVISAIRAIDDGAIILVGTPTWSQEVDKPADDPIKGQKNIMYVLHFYAATHKDWLRDRMTQALDKGLPIFVSEFGISDASGNGALDYGEAEAWIKLLNERGVSFVIWNLSNKNESSALLKDGNSKISGWGHDDLSAQGQWFVETAMKS